MALDFIDTEGFEHRELIRHNWAALGYVYWFTGNMVEYWRHLETKHVAAMTAY